MAIRAWRNSKGQHARNASGTPVNAVAPLMAPARMSIQATERLLIDTAQRIARQPAGWIVLVLHLSHMPAARPHHRRIARAILQDVAQRQDGKVFSVRNGDLVLLCRETTGLRSQQSGLEPQQLPATLERLLRIDSPDPVRLTSAWRADADPERLVSYATARLADGGAVAPAEEDPVCPTASIDLLANLAADPTSLDLMQRQTAVLLLAARPRPGDAADGGALRPLFTELGYSIATIEARAGTDGLATADPYLFRHLATRLDQHLLGALATALGGHGPLDALRQRHGVPPLHLNLTLPTLLSDGFACLAAATQAAGVGLGAEIAYSEACGDPGGFARARAVLAESNVTLTLDGVSYLSLTLSQPWALGADLVKFDWSARLQGLGGEERLHLDAALARIGTHRLVLHQADSEAALRWGLGVGIRRFQGRHVDAMLAASRIVSCPKSDECTLRQCVERASAVALGGRAACRNHALLDSAAP